MRDAAESKCLRTSCIAIVCASTTLAARGQDIEDDLGDLSLDELLQIKVTSVEGRAQSLLETPAAMFVITREDIRRSGHRSIAEALRMVPGFTVGQITPSQWAVGSRGLTDRFSNDLLVLIDGRSVYDPLFSGVFWNVQDVLFEDLDRIEVIRGPGATLWGANAVNGVVNITTKSARDTQGLYLSGGGGNLEQGFGAVRFGGELSENSHFRVYAKYDNHAALDNVLGNPSSTDWDMYRSGFRFDVSGSDELALTLQGDVYATGHNDASVRVPASGQHFAFNSASLEEQYQGGNVLFRAEQRHGENDGWSLQTFYDRTKTRGGQPGFEVRRDTFDIDYRQYCPVGDDERHVLMWGAGYRHSRDRTSNGPFINFIPRDRSLDTFHAFVQDTITLAPDKLHLMIGTKLEHNDHTGFEVQPSGRIWWTPDPDRTVWGAVSRAVRTPSRIADDVRLVTAFADPGLLPGGGGATNTYVPLVLAGDPGIDAEQVIAYEIGYRTRLADDLTLDIASFYNDYDDLITLQLPAGTFGNRGAADTYGVEVASTWNAADNWTLSAAYTFMRVDFDSPDGNAEEGETPQQQFNLRSQIDVTDDLEFNSALYFVDDIPDEGIDAYVRLDLGITWRPAPNIELAVWGQNLLDGSHPEFGDDLFQDVLLEVERSVYGQVSIRF